MGCFLGVQTTEEGESGLNSGGGGGEGGVVEESGRWRTI